MGRAADPESGEAEFEVVVVLAGMGEFCRPL
jgi:hypothetical protein